MSDEPKIFIDEDWKSQVQREREQARQQPQTEEPTAEAEGAPEAGELDGATFSSLVASLATQAMFALGAVAPDGAKQVMVDLDQARYLIDTLVVLEEKTQGNLTPEEAAQLKEARTELQNFFMARVQQFHEQSMREAGIDPLNIPRQ